MKIKTCYIANDGTEFEKESECLDYEARTSRVIADELAVMNRLCKFFNSDGKQISLDYRFNESNLYGVRIKCSADEVDDVMAIFKEHFDDLYFALKNSDFQIRHEVILVYDWISDYGNWIEIDSGAQEFYKFIFSVMEGT